jgi:hypothetical protein
MKSTIAACALLLGSMTAFPTHAAGRLAEIEVIDRDSGQPLETYYRHGEYWVAGAPGAHYAIYIRNQMGERLLAVTSVDGINVVTGQNAGWDQGGYVLDPWESYQVSGWRKSDYQVAAFAFTAAPASYAARTGRPENIGVIGVALFREQPVNALLPPQRPQIAGPEAAQHSAPLAERAERQAEQGAPAASPPSESRAASSDLSGNVVNAPAALARGPALGTAHGEREYSYVAHTQFVRRQWQPDEIIRIRYDSLDNLIAMGIVRPHRDAGPRPSPFPSTDPQYVPDPPSYQ